MDGFKVQGVCVCVCVRLELISKAEVLEWLSTNELQQHIRAIHNGEVCGFVLFLIASCGMNILFLHCPVCIYIILVDG